MTKPGYTHIIVPRDLHRKLKEEAKRRGLSISKMVRLLLEHGINTSINTLGEREKLENCPFSRNVVGRERFEPFKAWRYPPQTPIFMNSRLKSKKIFKINQNKEIP